MLMISWHKTIPGKRPDEANQIKCPDFYTKPYLVSCIPKR